MTPDLTKRFLSASLRLPMAFVRNVVSELDRKVGTPTIDSGFETEERIVRATSRYYAWLATEIKREMKIGLALGLYELKPDT